MSKAIEVLLSAWAGYPRPCAPVQGFGPRYFNADGPSRQDRYLTVELAIIRLGICRSRWYIRAKTLGWVAYDKIHEANDLALRDELGRA